MRLMLLLFIVGSCVGGGDRKDVVVIGQEGRFEGDFNTAAWAATNPTFRVRVANPTGYVVNVLINGQYAGWLGPWQYNFAALPEGTYTVTLISGYMTVAEYELSAPSYLAELTDDARKTLAAWVSARVAFAERTAGFRRRAALLAEREYPTEFMYLNSPWRLSPSEIDKLAAIVTAEPVERVDVARIMQAVDTCDPAGRDYAAIYTGAFVEFGLKLQAHGPHKLSVRTIDDRTGQERSGYEVQYIKKLWLVIGRDEWGVFPLRSSPTAVSIAAGHYVLRARNADGTGPKRQCALRATMAMDLPVASADQ